VTGRARGQMAAPSTPRRGGLDRRQAPLIRATIGADPETGEWLLGLLVHHIVADHRTQELILSEMELLLRGQGDRLAARLPYRNFVAQAYAVSPAEHEAYFRRELGEIEEPTAPFGLLDVQGDGSEVQDGHLALSAELAGGIRERARQQKVTPAVLFHVAWAQVLAQCSVQTDVVFGTVLMGRLQGLADASRLVGVFINTLPV